MLMDLKFAFKSACGQDFRPLAVGNLKLQNPLTFRGMTALLTVCMDEICSSWFDFIHNDWKRVSFYVPHFLIWTLREAEHGELNWYFVLAQIVVLLKELISHGLSGTREIWYSVLSEQNLVLTDAEKTELAMSRNLESWSDGISCVKWNVKVITARKRSCGKVMFLHLSVILFTGGGMCGERGCGKGGMHGKGVHVWQRGCTCMAKVGMCGMDDKWWGMHDKGVCVARGCVYAGEMATEAGGTHPTGMHSCWPCNEYGIFLSQLHVTMFTFKILSYFFQFVSFVLSELMFWIFLWVAGNVVRFSICMRT